MFSVRSSGTAPAGKKVRVVGIVGLGRYEVLFANALGAEVCAFTSSEHKAEGIQNHRAYHYVDTKGDFPNELAFGLDVIVSTQDVSEGFPLMEYMSMLDVHGRFVIVGLLDKPLPGFNAIPLLGHGAFFGGSHSASKKECV